MRTEEEARRLDRPPDLEAEREVDFANLGRTLVARWWLVAAAVAVGALVGWLVSVGGGNVYTAGATVYLGNPLSPGGAAIQSLSTNPATIDEIIHAESTIQRISGSLGISAGKLRAGISAKPVSTGASTKNSSGTSLTEISVRGPWEQETAQAANELARLVVARTSSYVNRKIEILRNQLNSKVRELRAIEEQIAAFTVALKGSSLTPLERLTLVTQESLAEQRRGQLLDQQTQTRQQLQIAQQVERGQIVAPAASRKVPARTSASSILVGAILGGLIGIALALGWNRSRGRRRVA